MINNINKKIPYTNKCILNEWSKNYNYGPRIYRYHEMYFTSLSQLSKNTLRWAQSPCWVNVFVSTVFVPLRQIFGKLEIFRLYFDLVVSKSLKIVAIPCSSKNFYAGRKILFSRDKNSNKARGEPMFLPGCSWDMILDETDFNTMFRPPWIEYPDDFWVHLSSFKVLNFALPIGFN